MSNLDQIDELFTRRVSEELAAQERKVPWLAKKTGISESTLRFQLANPKSRVSLAHARLISLALHVPLSDLVEDDRLQAVASAPDTNPADRQVSA